MRSFDFAPYYRSTVGFDRLFSMLDQVGGVEASAPRNEKGESSIPRSASVKQATATEMR
jgi:hypothetical protein